MPSLGDYGTIPSSENDAIEPAEPKPSASIGSSQYLLFLLLSSIVIGSHYGRHSLSSLSPLIMQELGVSRTEYGLLFSSQRLPGFVLPIITGVILTYAPLAESSIFLALALTAATALCAIALDVKSYMLLISGRFLFGCFDGALLTLEGSVVARAFKGRYGTGFGIVLFVTRLTTFLGLSLPAYFAELGGIRFAMWMSVVICIPSLLASIAFTFIVYRQADNPIINLPPIEYRSVDIKAVLRSLGLSFWMITSLWVIVSSVIFPTIHFITDALVSTFEMSSVKAGFLSGLLILVAGLTSPFIGHIADKGANRAFLLAATCGFLFVGSLFVALTFSAKVDSLTLLYLGLATLGVGLSLGPVTLLSSIAVVTNDVSISTALGVYKATQNVGLAIVHPAIGFARDVTGSYSLAFIGLAVISGLGIGISLAVGARENGLKEKSQQNTKS